MNIFLEQLYILYNYYSYILLYIIIFIKYIYFISVLSPETSESNVVKNYSLLFIITKVARALQYTTSNNDTY